MNYKEEFEVIYTKTKENKSAAIRYYKNIMLSRDTVCYINLNTGSSDAEKGFMDKAELDRALSGGEAGTEIQITEEEYLLQLIK